MIGSSILLAIVEILKATTQLAVTITATQTPAQQAIFWDRHLKETEWMSKLLEKLSDQIEQLIEKDVKPVAGALKPPMGTV